MTNPIDESPGARAPSPPEPTVSKEPDESLVEDSTMAAPSAQAESEEVRKRKRALRRKTIQFVVVFMVSVVILLAGYESAKDTPQNDRYLFTVAESTAFLLKWVGYSCSVGNPRQYAGKEAEVRAKIAAWEQGREVGAEAPSAEAPSGFSAEPLTAWEGYNFESLQWRRGIRDAETALDQFKQDPNLKEPQRTEQIQIVQTKVTEMKARDRGPYVGFVLRAGLPRQLTDQKAKLEAVKADSTLSEADRTAKAAEVQAEIDRLEREISAANDNGGRTVSPSGPTDSASGRTNRLDPEARPPHAKSDDEFFNFIVIPDCGAVQSMAIFFAAVVAFPGVRWWRRILGIVIGVTLLYWVNAFRLAFLAVIGALDSGGSIFKFTHEYVWQGIYIVFVVAIWMAWVELLVRRRD